MMQYLRTPTLHFKYKFVLITFLKTSTNALLMLYIKLYGPKISYLSNFTFIDNNWFGWCLKGEAGI